MLVDFDLALAVKSNLSYYTLRRRDLMGLNTNTVVSEPRLFWPEHIAYKKAFRFTLPRDRDDKALTGAVLNHLRRPSSRALQRSTCPLPRIRLVFEGAFGSHSAPYTSHQTCVY